MSGDAKKEETTKNDAQLAAIQQAERLQQMNKPVTQDDIRLRWLEFVQLLPQEDAAMRGRMESMQPQLIGPETFEVTVGNTQVAQDMKSMKARIEEHMRQRIGNYKLNMKISLLAQEEVLKYLTPLDRFKAMCEENPALLKLKERLGLRIVS